MQAEEHKITMAPEDESLKIITIQIWCTVDRSTAESSFDLDSKESLLASIVIESPRHGVRWLASLSRSTILKPDLDLQNNKTFE